MGFPMSGHLAQAGYDITVCNRTGSKADSWLSQYPGTKQNSPAAASTSADIVMTCVGNDDDLHEVLLGEYGALSSAQPNTLFVDHSTVSAEISQQLAHEAKKRHCSFLDAPVSGGQQGAEKGQLTVMVGGEEAAFNRALPVIKTYAKQVSRLGGSGAGQRCKMVNQVCVAGLIQALAEGLQLAMQSGLDVQQVVNVISQGAAQSWQMDNRHKTMIAGDYEHGFAVDWMRKDLAIVLAEAEKHGLQLPVTEQVDSFYRQIQHMGGGQWDTSSLLALLQNKDPR